jgi:tyrosine-specific transport protein
MSFRIKYEESGPKMFSAVMFIAGNTVGAGILALPIMLGLAGFFPAFIATCLMWSMMLFSGILMARQNILHKENIDLLSFFELKFGKVGLFIITIAYLFLFYGLSIAYISGATTCVINFIPWKLPYYPVMISVFLFLFLIVVMGIKTVLRGNNIMMLFLFISFFIIIIKSFASFKSTYIFYTDWKFLPATFPVLLCSFGYHNTIPIVSKAFKGNYNRIVRALFFGTLIPFILNIIILLAVVGILTPSNG